MLKVTLAGSFVNMSTPGPGIAGEPLKSYFLSRKYKKPQTKFFASVLAEKFFFHLVFAFFLIFSILFILFYIKISDNLRLILQIALFSIFLILIIFFTITFKKFKPKFNLSFISKAFYKIWFIKNNFENVDLFERYIKSRIKKVMANFRRILKYKKTFAFSVFLSFINWFFFYLISWFLFLSFGVNVNFLSIIIVVSLGMMIGEISPSPGGVGVTEGSMLLLYNVMGIHLSLAIIVALMSRLIFYFFSLIGGGISLAYLRFDLNKKEK